MVDTKFPVFHFIALSLGRDSNISQFTLNRGCFIFAQTRHSSTFSSFLSPLLIVCDPVEYFFAQKQHLRTSSFAFWQQDVEMCKDSSAREMTLDAFPRKPEERTTKRDEANMLRTECRAHLLLILNIKSRCEIYKSHSGNYNFLTALRPCTANK